MRAIRRGPSPFSNDDRDRCRGVAGAQLDSVSEHARVVKQRSLQHAVPDAPHVDDKPVAGIEAQLLPHA